MPIVHNDLAQDMGLITSYLTKVFVFVVVVVVVVVVVAVLSFNFVVG